MSQIEVDKVIPQSGTALQVGDSGDTITIPAGATITNNGTANGFGTADSQKVKVSSNDTTAGFLNGKLVAGTNISLTEGTDGGNETLTAALSGTIATAQIADDAVTLAKMAPGTDGNIISYDASGNPVAVATGSAGQILTSAGAGAPPTFATAAAAGITEADMFRLSANVSGDLTPISANLERADDATFAKLGTGVSVSSGVFTFASTGLYLIQLIPMFFFDGGADSNVNALIQGTPDNSNYDDLATAECGGDQGSNKKKQGLAEAYFNCTNVSTHKVRFRTASMGSNSLLGDTDFNKTTFTFIRLGDSQ